MTNVIGALLYYEVAGERRRMVLVHAGIADGRIWEGQIETFAGRYCVIRYDLRGIGKPPMWRASIRTTKTCRACWTLWRLVGRTSLAARWGRCGFRLRAPVPGEGQGARTGGVRRERISRKLRAPWGVGRTGRGRRGGNLGRVLELEVQIWVNGPGRRSEDVDGVVRDLVGEVNFIALRNEALGLGEELPPDLPAIDRLSEIRTPALIQDGNSNQPRTLAAVDLLASELPNARKVVMTGAARLRNMERPKQFNRLLLDYQENVE